MRNLVNRLWADDTGAIISVEMILIIGILIFGIIPGFVALRNSVNAAFGTIGNILVTLVPSFTFSGWLFVGSPGGSAIALVQGYFLSNTTVTQLDGSQTPPLPINNLVIPPAP